MYIHPKSSHPKFQSNPIKTVGYLKAHFHATILSERFARSMSELIARLFPFGENRTISRFYYNASHSMNSPIFVLFQSMETIAMLVNNF